MSTLTRVAIRYRKITLLLTAAVVCFGFYSYRYIPKQENPEVAAPVALVSTIYPGASPHAVESLVTKKVEDAISEIDGFEHVESFSRSSVSVVVVFLRQDADAERAWTELRQEVDAVTGDLPDLCLEPEVNTNLAETAGMIISLSGADYSNDQLVGFAEEFKRGLSRVDGIRRFDINGEVKKRVLVEVQIERLNQFALSLEDLVNILKAQNVEIPSGSISGDGFKINVSTPGIFESVKDIGDVVIDVSPETGAIVRLKDVADVHMAREEGASRTRHNGQGAVLLSGYFQPGENIVLIGEEVRRTLSDLRRQFPPGLQVDEVLFQPGDVQLAVAGFVANLLQGIALVIVVVFLGMGLRNALVVSAAIPLSVLSTFGFIWIAGMQVDQISTAALIISLGMLVDNAIVIADAIQVRIDRGIDRFEAAVQGARDSAIPVFTATLTTVAAYSPLLFLPGPVGDFTESIPQIVIISLLSSYVVAMLVTPTLAVMFFRPLKVQASRSGWLRVGFLWLLGLGLRRKVATIGIALLALGGAVLLQSQLGLSFFPYASKPLAHLAVRAEMVDLDSVDRLASEVEEILAREPEVTSYTTSIGDGLPKFYITVPRATRAEDYAQILFHFDLERGGRFDHLTELGYHLHQTFNREIVGGSVSVKLLELADPSAAPVVVRVSGARLERIEEVAEQLKAALREIPDTVDVGDDASKKSMEFAVNVDNDIANNMGISKYDIQRQINIALYGGDASVFRTGAKEYDIVVKSDIQSKEDLDNLAIKSRVAGHKVLLKQIAEIGIRARVERITRYRREKSVAVTAQVQPGMSSVVIENDLEQILPGLDLDGVNLTFDGEREKIGKNFGNVGVSALFALVAVYLILLLQFNSFRQPLVILLTVPLSVIGSILGLFLFRQSMSFTALLGMASLIGIVVNNAILLLDYIGKARRTGFGIGQACVDAVSKRLRPIGLSTITTVFGLTPLLISDNPLFTPLSISLMSGLLVSTLLTMVVIPVVYATAFRDHPTQPSDRETDRGFMDGTQFTP